MATRETCSRLVQMLVALGYSHAYPDLCAKAWVGATSSLNDLELAAAVVEWTRAGSPFWPKPSDLYALVPRVAQERMLLAIDTSDEDWAAARRLASSMQWGTTPDASPAVQAGVDALGGWDRLGMMQAKDVPSYRASFRGAHKAFCERRGACDVAYSQITEADAAKLVSDIGRAIEDRKK